MSNRPIVIGVTGGSGSGKSSVSMKLMEIFADLSVMMLQHDFYYKDQSHLPLKKDLKPTMTIHWLSTRIYSWPISIAS